MIAGGGIDGGMVADGLMVDGCCMVAGD